MRQKISRLAYILLGITLLANPSYAQTTIDQRLEKLRKTYDDEVFITYVKDGIDRTPHLELSRHKRVVDLTRLYNKRLEELHDQLKRQRKNEDAIKVRLELDRLKKDFLYKKALKEITTYHIQRKKELEIREKPKPSHLPLPDQRTLLPISEANITQGGETNTIKYAFIDKDGKQGIYILNFDYSKAMKDQRKPKEAILRIFIPDIKNAGTRSSIGVSQNNHQIGKKKGLTKSGKWLEIELPFLQRPTTNNLELTIEMLGTDGLAISRITSGNPPELILEYRE